MTAIMTVMIEKIMTDEKIMTEVMNIRKNPSWLTEIVMTGLQIMIEVMIVVAHPVMTYEPIVMIVGEPASDGGKQPPLSFETKSPKS